MSTHTNLGEIAQRSPWAAQAFRRVRTDPQRPGALLVLVLPLATTPHVGGPLRAPWEVWAVGIGYDMPPEWLAAHPEWVVTCGAGGVGQGFRERWPEGWKFWMAARVGGAMRAIEVWELRAEREGGAAWEEITWRPGWPEPEVKYGGRLHRAARGDHTHLWHELLALVEPPHAEHDETRESLVRRLNDHLPALYRKRRRRRLSMTAIAGVLAYSRQHLYELFRDYGIDQERVQRWQPGDTII